MLNNDIYEDLRRLEMESLEANPQKEIDVLSLMRRWEKQLKMLSAENVKLVLDFLNGRFGTK
jgi:hypothetical protein